jgi:uncharacterized Fe-S center protein
MKQHRALRKTTARPRKYHGRCEGCGKEVCACSIYQYTDEDNETITNNSPFLCKACYEERYDVTIQTDVRKFKDRLIKRLMELSHDGIDLSDTPKLCKYIDVFD